MYKKKDNNVKSAYGGSIKKLTPGRILYSDKLFLDDNTHVIDFSDKNIEDIGKSWRSYTYRTPEDPDRSKRLTSYCFESISTSGWMILKLEDKKIVYSVDIYRIEDGVVSSKGIYVTVPGYLRKNGVDDILVETVPESSKDIEEIKKIFSKAGYKQVNFWKSEV